MSITPERRMAARAALDAQQIHNVGSELLVEWVDVLLLESRDTFYAHGHDLDAGTLTHDIVDGTTLVVFIESALRVMADVPQLAWATIEGEYEHPAEAVFAAFTDLGERIAEAEITQLREDDTPDA